MLTILVPSFLLLIVIAHQPLNTFGESMPKGASTSDQVVQKLDKIIELMEKDNEKTRIYNIEPKNIYIIEPQNASLDNSLINEGSLKEKTSGKYDEEMNSEKYDEEKTSQKYDEDKNSQKYDEDKNSQKYDEEKDSQKYDENFNCIKNCNSKDETCNDATSRNDFKDGVYLLEIPKSISKPFYVYCHHENKNEEAWTIIQRRQDGSVNFNRTWLDYKLGFGDLNGEYWIGLERIHQITNSRPHELLVVLYEFDSSENFAKFSKFVVGSEDEGYKLTVYGASGYRTFHFMENNHMKFSTFDKDNDIADWHCGLSYGSGWWHRSCFKSNLNGPYPFNLNANSEPDVHVLSWYDYHPIPKVFMAIRPIGV